MKAYQLLFTLFAVFFCINSLAQGNGKTDSLEKAFATAQHDTIRSRVLNGLFNAYLYNDAEKAKMYALKGIDLGKNVGNKNIETSCNYILGVYYSFTPKSDSAEYFYKKTIQDCRAMGDSLSAGVGQAFSSLAIITQERGDFEESERLFKKSLDMDIARKDTVNMSISYSQLGRHYITRGFLFTRAIGIVLFITVKISLISILKCPISKEGYHTLNKMNKQLS
ncbi:tetratricopeptide repeat protein [Jiulongibacter sediminis]|uniref:tetratricopeptide repeat protein n=1 Tax=Jiulongibacter sediminis TaxID=1605367 RepID=UPI0026E92710|nr:tetratricopeptide repeat protein [Jiulongibacter sediminis]